MMLQGADAETRNAASDPRQTPDGLPQSSPLHTSAEATSMDGHHMSEEMKRCIQLCQDCHAVCVQTIGHCLRMGGRHAAPEHIKLLMDCAQICTTTADYMARESSLHDRMCGLCSEICGLCADSCEHVGGDDHMVKQCAELCHRCAGSCERMASKGAA